VSEACISSVCNLYIEGCNVPVVFFVLSESSLQYQQITMLMLAYFLKIR
jgi:hypothetical protein